MLSFYGKLLFCQVIVNTKEVCGTALGAFYRRIKARLGAPKTIGAAAHKLAIMIYSMMKNKPSYQEKGPLYFEKEYRIRTERRLKRLAKHRLCFDC